MSQGIISHGIGLFLPEYSIRVRTGPLLLPWITFNPCMDYKNSLHLDVVDRYLRRMGDKTIPDIVFTKSLT